MELYNLIINGEITNSYTSFNEAREVANESLKQGDHIQIRLTVDKL